ncbi:LysR family transcriptional regulator [Leptolyngbya sp. FACHB-261]|uniref:LysR family transcriptional regulator n=1 Tax=Leptolyngbya sp. FACHB-261 TaxID=2692806 RepID=UPI001681D6B0|nr:LysR family transcriptional regulator [Leptolyngbya sp. FACHB-261]MBD2101866.1 LysR family transcriptional regulator [Leptolyngbya sp. FACHB-261]
MRLEQLQAFLAVAESGSFQQAARKCACSQPTISRQIQSLEEQLGLSLFHRSSQARLTVGGERFLAHARRICQEWSSACNELSDLLAGRQPELCIAAIHSVCAGYLPPVLQQFCQSYPDVQLRVTSLGSDRALKVLRDGLVDVCIVMHNRFLTSSAELVVDVLFEEPILALMAADHPLAQSWAWTDGLPWSEVANYPQVVFKDGYGMRRLIEEQFERLRLTLHSAMELNTLDAFRGVVRQGDLVALLPQSAVSEALNDPGLAVRKLGTPALKRQVVLVTTRDRLAIPPIQHFRELANHYIRSQLLNAALPLSVPQLVR